MWQTSRRTFLATSACFLLPPLAFAENTRTPVLHWKLDNYGDLALESVIGKEDRITSRTGHAIWVGAGRDRALRLDGYSVWIDHVGIPAGIAEAFTISAWLALEAYPCRPASIVTLGMTRENAFHFGINRWGFIEISAGIGAGQKAYASARPVPRGQWAHVAVSVTRSGEIVLYQDGIPVGSVTGTWPKVTVGTAAQATLGKLGGDPLVAGTFESDVLNGLLRDVVVFDTALTQDAIRELIRDSKPAAHVDLQLNRGWCVEDQQRPRYHALPPRAWTNEPHGCLFWRGQYHLFYQKNANGPYWGNINWGHMTSPNLYHWTEMRVALSPQPGPDSEGCWSGSAIEYNGKLALVYTGGDGHRSSLCVAFSEDGVNFTKFKGNPVIAAPPEGDNYQEFRDPFVWREGKTYYMIVGSAIKDVGGAALLYRSHDLLTWQYIRPLLTGTKESSGVFWEMPVLVRVGNHHVLIVCEVPGRASYWVGTWKDEEFHPISTIPLRLELFNHLLSPTPHIAVDGRVIVMGIIPDERRPRETWKAGWAHLYSMPRVLSIDDSGQLSQMPLETIRNWCSPLYKTQNVMLMGGVARTFEAAAGSGVEIEIEFRQGESHAVSVFLRRSPDGREQTEIRYEWATETLILDRRQSSLDPLVRRDFQSATYKRIERDKIRLVIFLDQSVVEVFIDGRAAFATRIYPTLTESVGLAAGCIGDAAMIELLSVARIGPIAVPQDVLDVASAEPSADSLRLRPYLSVK